ncbi:MAG: TetR/AcrR family transcriptional regulator [Oscillospiraceae bacterium]
MPPKAKFTKEEVIAIAIALIAEKGMEGFSARELAKKLGKSVSPIFTAFGSMEELELEVREAVMGRFNARLKKAAAYTPAFKEVGMQMVRFAKEEPRLFKMLFMTENAGAKNPEIIFGNLGEMEDLCINLIRHDYGFERDDAVTLFQHVWTYTYGICAMCASGLCTFSEEELFSRLGAEFFAIMMFIKSGKAKDEMPVPAFNKEEAERHGQMWRELKEKE